MFIEGVIDYDECVSKARSFVNDTRIESGLSNMGISKEQLGTIIEENGDILHSLVLVIARFIKPGSVLSSSYAAVVSRLMDYAGIEGYRFIAGFCLSRGSSNYSTDKEFFNRRRAFDSHPCASNHVFVYYNHKYYESFNGSYDNIEHLDCIDVESRIEFIQ